MSKEESPLDMVKIQDDKRFETAQEVEVKKCTYPTLQERRIEMGKASEIQKAATDSANLKAIKLSESEYSIASKCANCTKYTDVVLSRGTVLVGTSFECENCGVSNKISEVSNDGLATGIIGGSDGSEE